MEFTPEYLRAVRKELEKRGKSEEEVENYITKLISGEPMDENEPVKEAPEEEVEEEEVESEEAPEEEVETE